MKREEIKKLLTIVQNTPYELGGQDAQEQVLENINSMHNLLTEICESLILSVDQNNYCVECDQWASDKIEHKEGCTYLKAQQYLQDTKEKS